MEPLPSPTTPSTPLSPAFAHPLDSSADGKRIPPRLQVVTSLPFHQILRQSSQSQSGSPSATAHPTTLRRRRSASSLSSISFSPAAEAILDQPLTALPTPMSPSGRLYPNSDRMSSPKQEDGRQSRMSIRSPITTPLSSPILERVLALPLRINANSLSSGAATTNSEVQQSTTLSAESKAEEPYTRWWPWTPVHSRAPAIFPRSRSNSPSHSRSRSRTSQHRASSATSTGSIKKRVRSPPPRYHVTVVPSLGSRLSPQQIYPSLPAYNYAVSHLRTPLVPLISVTTGFSHPEFPRSLLQYHLLTHVQLDSLARWYHQVEPPTDESWMYPAWIPPYTMRAMWQAQQPSRFTSKITTNGGAMDGVTLATKKRRWGRFIGLRGCESPEGLDAEEQESLVERMEREWRRAIDRAREEEMMREKNWKGRW